jgi:cytochrome c oxidase subunit 2
MTVKVFAQQFAWRFVYPDDGDVRSNELVLPVDRAIEVELSSPDVIHSFWIPQMGQKQDVVPGIDTGIVITPNRTGSFTLVCTELCGLGHSTMRAPVRVVEQDAFAAWVEEQQAGGGGTSDDGAQVFASAGCGGCHVFTPAGSNGAVGPSLDDLAASAEQAGQPLEEFARESIVKPNEYVSPEYSPGVMPQTFGESLTNTEIDALVAYLTKAKES